MAQVGTAYHGLALFCKAGTSWYEVEKPSKGRHGLETMAQVNLVWHTLAVSRHNVMDCHFLVQSGLA